MDLFRIALANLRFSAHRDESITLAVSAIGQAAGSASTTTRWSRRSWSSISAATFADPANSFHEKAALCRAVENTCYFPTVNYASPGSPTTSAIVRPDGTLLSYQPHGEEGLLLAGRCKY